MALIISNKFNPSGGLSKNDNGTLRVGSRIPSDSFPKGEIIGDQFYHTGYKVLFAWNGTAWDPIGGLKIYNKSVASGSGSTSSTAFVDFPGPIDLAFTKVATHTLLTIWGTITHYLTAVPGLTAHALLINGVDYSVGDFFFNTLSEHTTIGISSNIALGLAAGNYTARLRWRSVFGGGMVINADGNDVANFNILEGR